MNLHRATSQSDWAGLSTSSLNKWQRLASRSRGIVTPGNIVSLAGLIVVLIGVWLVFTNRIFAGIALIAFGRVCDMVDGYVAHATGTKSPLGEAIDATCDKVVIFVALFAFGFTGIVWWTAIAAVGAQNAINSLVSIVAARRNHTLHPSVMGKQATVWQWIGLIGAVIAHTAPYITWLAYGCVLIGIVLGVIASWRYVELGLF